MPKAHLRGAGINLPDDPEKVGLPARPFLYTLDQIATLINVELRQVKARYIYFEGRSTGIRSRGLLSARDISPNPGDVPEWRIAERELLRWLKFKGFKVYEVGVVSH